MYYLYSPFGRSTRQFKLDNHCLGTGKVEMTWTNEKIQEWRHRLGYVSTHFVKRNFEASNQFYPVVRHEHNVVPKKSAVVRFISLPNPMHSIRRNKEKIYWAQQRIPTLVKSRWGLVFIE